MLTQRKTIPDTLKGLGILLVVLGHVFRGLVNGGIAADWPWIQAVDRTIYSFHMSLFFFVSGWLFAVSTAQKKNSTQGMLRRLWQIFYLYVLWSLLEGGTQIALSSYTTTSTKWTDLVAIFWRPHDHFWFLYELFFVTFWGWAFLFWSSVRASHVIFAGALAGWVFFPHGPFSTWFICYAAGYVLCPYLDKIKAGEINGASLMLLAAFGIAFFTWQYSLQTDVISLKTQYLLLFSYVVGTGFCLQLVRLLRGRASKLFAFLGMRTLPIYLAHIFFAAGTRIFLLKGLHIDDPVLHLIAGVGAGMIGPVLLYKLSQRLRLGLLFQAPRVYGI